MVSATVEVESEFVCGARGQGERHADGNKLACSGGTRREAGGLCTPLLICALIPMGFNVSTGE